MQGDNDVVNTGKDCVSEAVFGVGTCAFGVPGTNTFAYVVIGNGTTATVLAVDATAPTGTVVTIDTSNKPFSFDADNAIIVRFWSV